MSLLPVPMEVTSISLSGVNLTFVAVVGVVALIALVMAMIFRREVLAANDGTPKMQSIARGVQEGASAYLDSPVPHPECVRSSRLLPSVAAAGARQR